MSDVIFSPNSKSLLAKLMSEEDIRVRHQNVTTASFDVVNRVLTLPIWNDMTVDTYDLLVGHEVGHALYTTSNSDEFLGAHKRSNADFVNVIEDIRIEKLIRRKFLGLRSSFVRGYRDLISRNFFGIENKKIEDINFIDRLNIFFKCSIAENYIESKWFSDEEMPFVERAKNLETFDEVSLLAEDIFNYLKSKKNQLPKSAIPDISFDSGDESIASEDNESDVYGEIVKTDNDSSDSEKSSPSDNVESRDNSTATEGNASENSDKNSENSENDVESKNAGSEKSEKSDKSNTPKESDVESDNDKEFVSETDKIAKEMLQKMATKLSKEIVYASIPDFDPEYYINDYKIVHSEMSINIKKYTKENMFKELMDENTKVISYLVKEFEMKKSAKEYAKSFNSKTGSINASKLWSYKLNDDIFRQKNILPEGKNHGMIMLLDWSGSMQKNLLDTVKQTIILSAFCRRVNIPFDVYIFHDSIQVSSDDGIKYNSMIESMVIDDYLLPKDLRLRNVLSNRMTAKEFADASNNLLRLSKLYKHYYSCYDGIDKLGSTPLNESLMIVDKIINKFKNKNNLEKVNLVVLTDGESNSSAYKYGGDYFDHQGKFHRTYKSIYGYREVIFIDRSSGHKIYRKKLNDSMTKTLIDMIREKHKINAIGFYVVSSRQSIHHAIRTYITASGTITSSYFSDNKKELNKNNFLVATGYGFNQYYIIKSTETKTEDLKINSQMTKGKIATEFIKHNRSKQANRQLLSKFVELIK